jgi:aryl-alcohol dehydrogenase-like predicted oxidoreductase
MQQAEASLRRLQTDYVDVYYWLHDWDRTMPVEETLHGLASGAGPRPREGGARLSEFNRFSEIPRFRLSLERGFEAASRVRG